MMEHNGMDLNKRLLALALVCCFAFCGTAGAAVASKRSETVYVDLAHDGTAESIVSSVYITNPDKADTLSDRTTLTSIRNILGDTKPTQQGDTLTFQAKGEDVCYQGVSTAALPVSIHIAYTLDGRPITAEQLKGKSGRVGLDISTQNHTPVQREVDGESVTLYTPFSVICMLTLNERFSFIESDNGKVSAQAGVVSVMGILNPGLGESLGVADLEGVHDSMHLEASVKEFELEAATFIVMTGIVDENDLSSIEDVQDMLSGIQELTDAAGELYDGTDELRDGVGEYLDGLLDFYKGMDEFRVGVQRYNEGLRKYYDGVAEATTGTKKLWDGARELRTGVDAMRDSVKNTVIDSSGAITPERVQAVIQGTLASNRAALGSVGITTPAQYALIASLMGQAAGQLLTEQGQMTEAKLKLMLGELVKGLTKLSEGALCLDTGAWGLYEGMSKLQEGAMDLTVGGGKLYYGTEELQDGAKELYEGGTEIWDGTGELRSGVGELRDDGLQKLLDETSDISVSLSRKDALLVLSDAYTSFSCTDPEVSGSVQFLYTTKAVTMEAPIPTPTPAPAEVEMQDGEAAGWLARLWNTIKGWFGA